MSLDAADLYRRLDNVQIKRTYSHNESTYEVSAITSGAKEQVIACITTWLAENGSVDTAKRIAELEAKVYTYEAIIANSNFAPMVRNEVRTELEQLEAMNRHYERLKNGEV